MKVGYDFFSRHAVEVAKDLVGCFLVRWIQGEKIVGKIVETEAYPGPEDKGCHAYQNKRTARTEVMFYRGGHAYVYLIYGLHNCFNVVTGVEGMPEAVFIRALEPVYGWPLIEKHRPLKKHRKVELTNGPGKFTQALAIDTSFNGYDLVRGTALYFVRAPEMHHWQANSVHNQREIKAAPRVNIDYAEEFKHKLWRFYLDGNPFVST